MASDTQVFSFYDNQAPEVISSPADMTVACEENPEVVEPVFADNCSGNLEILFSEEVSGDDCAQTITRTWEAIDACGNSNSTSQIIQLVDEDAPVFDCPDDLDIELEENATSYLVPNWFATQATIDNCSENLILDQSIAQGTEIDAGTYTVTLTATDACGNLSSCDFNLNVQLYIGLAEQNRLNFKVFPNPTSDWVNISSNYRELLIVQVYDCSGRLISHSTSMGPNLKVDFTTLPPGVYRISLSTISGSRMNQTIIKY